MPNGGSDCCMTCWFNASNGGDAGYGHVRGEKLEPPFCLIRGFAIESPAYTYCANHPHRRPEKDPIPIGPVFFGGSGNGRRVGHSSPDTEEIRTHLLALLSDMREQPASEYPAGVYLDEVVVWQAGEFREPRALDDLRRIAAFDPSAAESGPFGRTREGLVHMARNAIDRIKNSQAEPPDGVRP